MKQDRSHARPGGGVSRRQFLRGSGAAAAATALATRGEEASAAAANNVLAAEPTKLTLNVNGEDREVSVEPRTTLMEALRYQLQLTGCKPVCTDGVSGAATVLLDGKPVNANVTLALACAGKPIRTAESLGGAQPDPVVSAFVHHDGMQCGFCTPGFVVAVRAFLDKNPQATEEQIRNGLNGNICRCGTYANVIMAAMEVVKGGA